MCSLFAYPFPPRLSRLAIHSPNVFLPFHRPILASPSVLVSRWPSPHNRIPCLPWHAGYYWQISSGALPTTRNTQWWTGTMTSILAFTHLRCSSDNMTWLQSWPATCSPRYPRLNRSQTEFWRALFPRLAGCGGNRSLSLHADPQSPARGVFQGVHA